MRSRPSASRPRWMAGPALARSISAPLAGSLIVPTTWRGTRTTRCASRASILTNPLIRLSSANSCACAGCTSQSATAAGRSSARAVWVPRRLVIQDLLPSRWSDGREHRGSRPFIAGLLLSIASIVIISIATAAREPRIVARKRDVGVPGRTERRQPGFLQIAGKREPLHAPATDRLTREEVAPGVDGDRVQEREVAGQVSGTAEAGEDAARPGAALHRRTGRRLIGKRERAVERPHDLLAAAGLEKEALIPVGREIEVPSGAGRVESDGWLAVCFARGHARAGNHGDDLLGLTHRRDARDPDRRRARAVRRVPVEHLDPVVGAIAHVEVPVVTHQYAVWVSRAAVREAATIVGGAIGVGAVDDHAAPVAQPASAAVEHDHAMVAVPVRDVDGTSLAGHGIGVGIHCDVGRLVEQCATVVQRSRRAAWPVADGMASDLQEQGAAVVGVFLDDAVSVAGDPDVVLVVDEAAMEAGRQDRKSVV